MNPFLIRRINSFSCATRPMNTTQGLRPLRNSLSPSLGKTRVRRTQAQHNLQPGQQDIYSARVTNLNESISTQTRGSLAAPACPSLHAHEIDTRMPRSGRHTLLCVPIWRRAHMEGVSGETFDAPVTAVSLNHPSIA